ncbi:MAG: phosphoglycerate dehydrogenase [Sulfobacillus thermosulfidooxidans]|uniref:phosphoglycerate dehydrogenase n=1 Tax=Sulfobacillus TaxID=28033 RepID=UPI000CD30283|nr:phosphoglycerate dehydrogenase [Sulfobacillus sp. hq2]POB11919.1 phosphoglycerate dehydrogenase [Sulfobacillus sp. hq2]PSR36364.1 MAG: phosphoglycerate dehydrogenase [Sulfobacillus thermosulfidooxidans]
MTRPRILITETLGQEGIDLLREVADVDAYDLLPKEQLPEIIGNYDAVIVRSAHRLPRETLIGHPRLKVVARAGSGVDNVDLKTCTELGIAVINAPGANAVAAAEQAFAHMLAILRNVHLGDAHVRSGEWSRKKFLGGELHERRLGIIGFGKVGREAARIANGFRMKVYAYDPFVADEIFQAHNVTRMETLEELLPVSDILTLHTPKSGPQIGLDLLSTLPAGAIVINVARGGMIDEEALATLMDTGHLLGVGLDVFSQEPPPADFPLFRHPRAVLTPHLGGSTHEAMTGVAVMTAQGVIAALQGLTPPNIVNVPVPPLTPDEFGMLDEGARIVGRIFAQMHRTLHAPIVLSLKGPIPKNALPWLKQTVLAAILNEQLADRVNAVNALVKAEEQGLKLLVEERDANALPTLALRLEGHPETTTEVSLENHVPRLRRINGVAVDLPWPDIALMTVHDDAPGVVGKVGTLVGQYGINIGNLHLGRQENNHQALMILSLDQTVPDDLVRDLNQITDIHHVFVF